MFSRLAPYLFLLVLGSYVLTVARGQTAPTQASTAQPAAVASATAEKTAPEMSSRDEAATFKVNVRLVLVRVVVRDQQGHAIGNLHKEDFQLFDNRKQQVISQFSVEQPGSTRAEVHGNPSGERDRADKNGERCGALYRIRLR